MPDSTRGSRSVATMLVALVATLVTACGSTTTSHATTTTGGSAGGSASIPSSAFSDHTGVTADTVTVANVSTLSAGLFKGAAVGTEAYAAYVNSTGGVNGRKIVVHGLDDTFTGAGNLQATTDGITNDFALVGGFSLEDSFGQKALAAHPGVPKVAESIDHATNALPNVYAPIPQPGGWEEGPLQYFAKKFPSDIKATGTIVGNLPTTQVAWAGEKNALDQVGYKVIYSPSYDVTQTDFTADVVAMKAAGVKLLLVDQLAANYASALLKNLVQQNFHPVVVLGAAAYTSTLVANSGGASAVNGDYLDQNQSLFLGGDAAALPSVATFLHWVQTTSPGFTADLFTLYGWLSAELFVKALKDAGSDPSRGSLLQQLSKVTSFDGDHISAPTNPAAKTLSNCYLLGQIVDGQFQRLDDPPIQSATNGYRCDYKYIAPPAGT
jgi:branched-chain amino acid transport system substrate-binding protein